ncbi:hypothetical protein DO021_01635 [Desulfobacter hydrogenophilus]|uniref:Uncharacterized protein n=1 Tax=Desulfobacter hydrogenophilus TaxID=2291 RepID=A0A328FIT4_9BACT|nr:hypothetical protein [Desulfobacter hydrogenophilus]NDY71834.1 hypothetical protein [Desulfobacter hydrogenophilus]QBH13530.1 hypothetical protein EYB58_11705 [Desulfobacter hydrogenophilus]RAM03780.1 hypothetical protein DO021_01635 [Desulfobacter hydrogenophilus]
MKDIYRINIGNKWKLEDLYEFPRAYYQVYAFQYCFMPDQNIEHKNQLLKIFKNYKDNGQYRYINIYKKFQLHVSQENKPDIFSMHYASPGWIDLLLNPEIALQISKSIAIYLGLSVTAAKTYKTIYKMLSEINQQRNKNKLNDFQLTKKQNEELIAMSNHIARLIGFDNVGQIDQYTGNPEVTLKILLAHYRRLKNIENFISDGKVSLTSNKKEGS